MAYNVLDGTVDYSTTQHTEIVDAHANQEIRGTKIIVGNLVDTDGRAIVPPAITKVEGGAKNAVITFQEGTSAKAEFNLTFDGETLVTRHVRATSFEGLGEKLRNLPPDQFSGPINARDLKLGPGLKNVRNDLQVDTGPGLTTVDGELSIDVTPKGGLRLNAGRVGVDPKNCTTIDVEGQNLSDDDVVMVHDVSRGELRNTTLSNLYASYLTAKIPSSVGPVNSIQFKARSGFKASPDLTYNPSSRVLNVDGTIVADALQVSGRTSFEGGIAANIHTVTEPVYKVATTDHTLLCDTARTKILVTLPPACNNPGRVLVVKKIDSDIYKLKSHLLTITVEEGKIDFKDTVEMKMTYSAASFQSDGVKWWIIGKTGS